MNHVVELKGKRYVIRRLPQKLILLSFPELKTLHKCYLNTSFSYINPSTREIMSIYNNEISILKPVVAPLQLAVTQQSFIDWQPSGGILLESSIVLYGCHGIVFYRRGAILEKAWQIDILQDIEEIKTNNNGQSIAMKVRNPSNSLFLWRLSEPSVKPTQQIILTQPIVQWQFIRNDLLVILTSSELRIYIAGSQNLFNLYHFYQVNAKSFCWVDYPWISRPNRLSVNSVILMQSKGLAKVIELYGLQRRVLDSESAEIGGMVLRYKSVSMKQVIGCWQDEGNVGLVCETKHRELFTFELSKSLEVISSKAQEQSLGADIKEVYANQSLVLVKDRSIWKYYKMISQGKFQLLQSLDCDKAFIGSQKRVYYLYQQAFYIKQVGGQRSEPIQFKYANPDKVQYISSGQQYCYLIAGIKFYKIAQGTVVPAGFAVKYERAELIAVDRLTQTLTYKLGGQNMLMNYRIEGDKCSASVCKSSEKELIGVKGGRWIEIQSHEFSIGEGEKILAVFPIAKLLKILDSQNKLFQYSLHSITGDGLVLLLKNYIFFLQIIQDEKGCEIALVKRLNTVLYTRLDPHAHTHKLIDPFCLTFWVGNSVVQMGSKINPHAIYDPYLPPETLLAKQLEMKRVFPPHHPRFIQILIQTNNLTLLLQLLKVVNSWSSKEQHSLADLYKQVGIEFISDILWGSRQEDLSRWPEQKAIEEGEFVGKLAEGILDNIQAIILKEKAPFILQSILQSFAYYLANSRIVDLFSQGVLILCKSAIMKGKPLSSMHIAFLLHSLNKEEAAAQLKPEKMSWDWLRDYSVPFWIDNKEQLRKWIQEIAAEEYRKIKDPFDSLFWYMLIGKKTLLITLFKNHRMNSKQHEAIFNFLQRDFNDPKNRSAAVKNAYVLIDKKRYLHSLAFFILGEAIDDCVRLCTDRLKDLNLTYVFVLLFKGVSNQYLFSQMRKGDIWMKHITYKLSSQHIESYNCLFEESDCKSWNYQPSLTGFHPAAIDFAQKLRNSVPVKRQLEIQRYESQSTQDIFADFFGSSEPAAEEPKKPKIELKGDIDHLKPQAVRYYIKQGAPILALNLSENNEQAKLAYSFELYKLTNEVRPEMEHIVLGLQDKLAIVKCFIANGKHNQLLAYLKKQIQVLKVTLSLVQLVEIIKTKKYVLGQILHFGYFMEKIALLLNESKDFGNLSEEFKKITADLGQLSMLSKIFACLIMNDYEALIPILEQINHVKLVAMPEIWQRFKTEYDNIIEQRKAKQLKQMDYFQHAFISTYRAIKREDIYRPDLEIISEEGALLILRISVLSFLGQRDLLLKQQILSLKEHTEKYLKSWLAPFKLSNLLQEFRILLKEGTQAKLKLPTLSQVFDSSFTQFFDLMAIVHAGYFQKHISLVPDQKQKELQAIEVFRNRQDGVKSFIINKHEGKGLQCVVLFKRLIKKFEVCENLAKRERTKDGYGLYTEDSGFTNMSHADPSVYLQTKHSAPVQQALNRIIKQRKYLTDKQFPRGCVPCPSKSYIRQIEAPYMDHNELNSIQCHPFLPFFLIGGKGLVEIAHLNSLKNFDRVKCTGMSQIVKLHSCGQRIGTVDNSGNLGIYNFDPTFHNNCVYSLKKASVVDFSYLNPSVLAVVSSSAVCVYDTLIQPKRQLKFKQPFTKEPIAVCSTLNNRIVVLRKSQVLIYDVRMQRLEGSRQLKSKGRSMHLEGSMLYVGQNESKVAVFDINSVSSNYETIRVGTGDEKERQRYSIDQICGYDDVTLAMNNEGSIYYLPLIDKDSLK